MTTGKETLPIQLEYHRTQTARIEIPLRLRIFLFGMTAFAIAFGILLAYLIH